MSTPVRDVDGQSGSDAAAMRSAAANWPRENFRKPAAAIIAALSVERCVLGKNTGMPARAPRACAICRRREFADTPPAMPMLRALNHLAAASVLLTSV